MFSQWSPAKKFQLFLLLFVLAFCLILCFCAKNAQAQVAAVPTDHWLSYDQCNTAVVINMATSYVSGFQNPQVPDTAKGEKLISSPTKAWCVNEQTRYEGGWFWVYHNGPLLQRGDFLFDPQCNNKIREARPVVFPQVVASAPAALVVPQQQQAPAPVNVYVTLPPPTQEQQGGFGSNGADYAPPVCTRILGVYSRGCPDYGYGSGNMGYSYPSYPVIDAGLNVCFGPSCGGGFYGGGGYGGGGYSNTSINNINNITNYGNNGGSRHHPYPITAGVPPSGSTGGVLGDGTPPGGGTGGSGGTGTGGNTGNVFRQTGRGNTTGGPSNTSWAGNTTTARNPVQQYRGGNNQSVTPNRNMGSTRSYGGNQQRSAGGGVSRASSGGHRR